MAPSPIPQTFRFQFSCILILVLVPLILYFNSLKGAFLYDDQRFQDYEWMQDLGQFKKDVHLRHIQNRPIYIFTIALNHSLNRNNVFGFHLVNLLLHVCVSILIFCIIWQARIFLRREDPLPDRGSGSIFPSTNSYWALPILAALLFAVHPLNTDSVSYISSRSSLLATFFYLLTLYIFLTIFSPASFKDRITVKAGLAILVVVGFYLAVASKLIALTLPVLLALCLVFVVSRYRYPRMREFLLSKSMMTFYGAIFIIVFYKVWHYKPLDQGLEMYGRFSYFLLQFKVVFFYYLKSFFLPFNLAVDPGFPFTTFFADPLIPLSIVLALGLIIWIFIAGNLYLKIGIVWTILTLAPTSSLVPLNDLAAEHRLYLPMTLGLCLILGGVLYTMALRWRKFYLLVFLLAAMSLLTIDRNEVWRNEISLWSDVMRKNPKSPRPYYNLGKGYYEKKEFEKAKHLFLQSVNIDPEFVQPHSSLGSLYLDEMRLEDAEREYQTALRLDPKHYESYLGLGSVYRQKGQFDLAIKNYERAIEVKRHTVGSKDYPLARLNLGVVYGQSGRFEEAVRESLLALESPYYRDQALLNLGNAYWALKQFEKAEKNLLASYKINPDLKETALSLGRFYQSLRRWEESTRFFETYLNLAGPDAKIFFDIGFNHHQAGNLEQSITFYEKSIEAQPDYLNAHLNLGAVLMQAKRYDQAIEIFNHLLEQHPQLAQVHLRLGVLYWQVKKNKTQALVHLLKAIEINPQLKTLKEISQLMDELSRSGGRVQ